MGREAWQVTVHGVDEVGHDLVTKQQHNKLVISWVNRFPWVLWAVPAITQTQRETRGNFWFVFSQPEAHVTTQVCCCHLTWWDCGIRFYLWVRSVRIELNHWTPSWCLRTATWYEEAFSWQNSVSPCPSLLHFVLQGQTCLLLQVSLDFLLLYCSPLWWKGHLFLVLALEGLHRII